MRPDIPFWVRGYYDDSEFGIFAEHRADDDVVELATLVVSPTSQSASIFARLTGTIGGDPVRVTVMATADTPFVNVAPFADAGPDREATTSCTAELTLDASGTEDVDGNLARTYYTEAGRSIGRAGSSIRFPIGTHRTRLIADDADFGRGTDDATVTVLDNGDAEAVPGAEVIAIDVPAGALAEDLTLVASHSLVLGHRADVLPETGGNVASLGTLEVGMSASVGEAWSVDDASLLRDATVRGNLHAGASIDIASGARILGATLHDSLLPSARTTFYVVLPTSSGADVVASPGETVAVPVGDHGTLRAMPGSSLVLAPGVHTASSLDLLANSHLVAPASAEPTVLVVTDSVRQLGMVGADGADPNLLVVYLGSAPFRAQASFHGWVIAPNATLSFETAAMHRAGSDPPHRGAFFARDISAAESAVIEHFPLDLGFVRQARGACVLEPILECVREETASFVAVFGYRSVLERFGASVPAGLFNRVEIDGATSPGVPGQPVAFFPRLQERVFEVPFMTSASWTLGARRASASEGSVRCP